MNRKPYSAPQLIAHGKLEDLTHGSVTTPKRTDMAFPSGTPIHSFTFT
ncbi:lasso RiPP family leader peptide-containing protein [Sagittula sp. S175]